MKKSSIPVLVLLFSLMFNLGFFIAYTLGNHVSTGWSLVDIGPAVIQDSYYGGAIALESPFGMIGVVPGGYSPYFGNPLQNPSYLPYSQWIDSRVPIELANPSVDMNMLLVAVILLVIPIFLVYAIGRRSYGATKAQ
ncbi:hypothetical protein EU537_07575 [Candidatus Thorarchaeota archaeon]|nr:MAG: hypothetical protein EU537_07575 [Candidatus Thorarchaeota archaeon]